MPTSNPEPRRRPARGAAGRAGRAPGRGALAALVALAFLVLAGCSVQEAALIKVAFIQDRIAVPAGTRAVTIRVNRVGTTRRLEPVSAETSFCDVEGDFTLKTTKIGRGHVVARGPEFEIAYAPVFIEEFGEVVDLGQLIPSTSVELSLKATDTSLFLVFEEDWEEAFGEVTQVDLVGPDSFALDDQARPMYDDGSELDIDHVTPGIQRSGDFARGDGIWTLRVDRAGFPAGERRYGFFINKNEERGIQRDPYEESSSGGRSVILVP